MHAASSHEPAGSCSTSSRPPLPPPPPLRLRYRISTPSHTHATLRSCLPACRPVLPRVEAREGLAGAEPREKEIRCAVQRETLVLSFSRPSLGCLYSLSLLLSHFHPPSRSLSALEAAGGRRHPRDSSREISDLRALYGCVSARVVSSIAQLIPRATRARARTLVIFEPVNPSRSADSVCVAKLISERYAEYPPRKKSTRGGRSFLRISVDSLSFPLFAKCPGLTYFRATGSPLEQSERSSFLFSSFRITVDLEERSAWNEFISIVSRLHLFFLASS